MRLFQTGASHRWLRRGERGSIGIWVATMAPGLLMAGAMGVEVSGWATAQVSIQRTADAAALAAAVNYNSMTNASTSLQTVATYAARIANLNGIEGATTPSWNAASNTLTSNKITVKFVSTLTNGTTFSVKDSMALQVTVQKPINKIWSGAFSSSAPVTVSATSVAQIMNSTTTTNTSGNYIAIGTYCFLALNSTTSNTFFSAGTVTINSPNCTIFSNKDIDISQSGTLNTKGLYSVQTGSTVTGQVWNNLGIWIKQGVILGPTSTLNPGQTVMTDPYASDTRITDVFNAITVLPTTLPAISCSGTGAAANCYNVANNSAILPYAGTGNTSTGVYTWNPGNYDRMAVIGGGPYTFTFNPGLYMFKNGINFAGATTSSALNGVTIATGTGFVSGGTFNWTHRAPSSSVSNSIIGIAHMTNSTAGFYISNGSTFSVDGAVYAPNGQYNTQGLYITNGITQPGTCFQVVANTIRMEGSSSVDNSGCNSTYNQTTVTTTKTSIGVVK